jgi:hypothetical protein
MSNPRCQRIGTCKCGWNCLDGRIGACQDLDVSWHLDSIFGAANEICSIWIFNSNIVVQDPPISLYWSLLHCMDRARPAKGVEPARVGRHVHGPSFYERALYEYLFTFLFLPRSLLYTGTLQLRDFVVQPVEPES